MECSFSCALLNNIHFVLSASNTHASRLIPSTNKDAIKHGERYDETFLSGTIRVCNRLCLKEPNSDFVQSHVIGWISTNIPEGKMVSKLFYNERCEIWQTCVEFCFHHVLNIQTLSKAHSYIY